MDSFVDAWNTGDMDKLDASVTENLKRTSPAGNEADSRFAEHHYTVDDAGADSFVFSPIIEATGNRWSTVLNPVVAQSFNGADEDDKPDFSYAFSVRARNMARGYGGLQEN